MSSLLAVYHQSKRLMLSILLKSDSHKRQPCPLETEPMMLVWFCKRMLELVFSEKKVNKLQEVPILLLDNSNIWNLCFSSTVARLTDVIHYWCCTTSTRTSCMWFHSSTLDSMPLCQDNHFMNNWFTKCIILQWHRCPFFGIAFLTSNTKRILTCKWHYLNQSLRAISWEIPCSTELVLKERASPRGSL